MPYDDRYTPDAVTISADLEILPDQWITAAASVSDTGTIREVTLSLAEETLARLICADAVQAFRRAVAELLPEQLALAAQDNRSNHALRE